MEMGKGEYDLEKKSCLIQICHKILVIGLIFRKFYVISFIISKNKIIYTSYRLLINKLQKVLTRFVRPYSFLNEEDIEKNNNFLLKVKALIYS